MKKFYVKTLLILFLLIALISTMSSASYNNVTMSVVEEPICTINFGTNSYFEKKLYSKNLDDKKVNIQLKVTNNEESLKPTGEIMLVIDNSNSMNDPVYNGKTREDLVIDSAKNLITNLLEDNTKLKIGAVSFSSNVDIALEGTIEDAKLISNLTNDSTSLLSSVSNIEYNGPRTNLESGIALAEKYFTNDVDKNHKYIIVLSDGVPNVAIDYDKNYFSDDVISKTKSKLQSCSTFMNTDNIIIMLTGIANGEAIAAPSTKTYNEIISEVFGTIEKPTVGKFYYVTDDKIEETITSNIYKDLLPISQSFKDIKIVDYFPEEIVDNFEFACVATSSIGNISEQIDKTTNSITWTIPELKSGQTITVNYELKLIKNYSPNIVDKILDTNEKVDLSYTDYSNSTNTKTSDVTPKLKLIEPTPEEIKKDEETRPTVLPKAGKTILLSFIVLVVIIAFVLGIRYFIIKNKMK